MKKKDLQKEDLPKLLKEKREAIKEFRFKSVAGGLKNTKELRENKKEIARMLTILNKK
ncbi:MAG: 50S ribosomal protein L29 [Candidatus Paceibacterota bacterium]|jgi:ribosomal protein L29